MAPAPAGTSQTALTVSTVGAAQPRPVPPAGGGMQAIACGTLNSASYITTVNGQRRGIVFTPDPKYNLYTIKGCGFGDAQGQAHLNGSFAAGQMPLQIETWTNTEIHAKVVLQNGGEPDEDNVTLIVSPASLAQLQADGFKFYAERATIQLATIPQSSVSMGPTKSWGGQSVSTSFRTPSNDFKGASAEVFRSVIETAFNGGQDYYDFSKLTPGFATDSMNIVFLDLPTAMTCDDSNLGIGQVTYYRDSPFSAAWDGDNVRVTYGEQHCHLSATLSGNHDYGYSDYALSVWVTGPKGVAPWR